jgi:hypothetical protein
MRITLLHSVLFLIPILGFAQNSFPPPLHDACIRAQRIEVGQTLYQESNQQATLGIPGETPAMLETTCIQSPENDLWYRFTTQPDVEWYEVVISMGPCNTPAGLQALLIKTNSCFRDDFKYRGCANKINTDTIKIFLHEPMAGIQHLIWVDGYDGTQCLFDISVQARQPLEASDFRYLRNDYLPSESIDAQSPQPNITFENNSARIRWEGNPMEPTALYLVERMPDLPESQAELSYGRVVGMVEPDAGVGGGLVQYEFEDLDPSFIKGKPVRYRVVKIDADGSRHPSDLVTVVPQPIESFFVESPKKGSLAGVMTVKYVNLKKGQNFQMSVLDQEGNVVKKSTLKKEPARDGTITLQMSGFRHGSYTFVMCNGSDCFRRPFVFTE